MPGPGRTRDSTEQLPFFPRDGVTADELRTILRQGTPEQRAWAISNLLSYAQWDDIWSFVTRDQVRAIFPDLELPATLKSRYARILKIKVEAPVA